MKTRLFIKKILTALLLLCLCAAVCAQSVLIHHIGVGQGDATLFILTDTGGKTVSILIDAGNSKGKGDTVFSVMNAYLGKTKYIDFIIVSHLHSDHMGGMPEVLDLMAAQGWSAGLVIDRSANGQSDGDTELCYDDGTFFDSNDDVPAVPSTTLIKKYKSSVNGLVKKKGWLNIAAGVDLLSFRSDTHFAASGMYFRTLTSNGYVCEKASDYSDWTNIAGTSKYENDYSYSFLLEMGQFKYFTGGDIGGENPYADLETPLVKLFNSRTDSSTFHFCAYKASHHGSLHSTNTAFVARTTPTVTVVPSALRSFSGTQLPGQATINRITNSSTNVYLYYTYTYQTNPWAGAVQGYKDVIINVNGATYSGNHAMTITQLLRNKDLTWNGGPTVTTAYCTKQH